MTIFVRYEYITLPRSSLLYYPLLNCNIIQVAGEIMRAVTKLNQNFYTNGTLTNLTSEFNFIFMSGVLDGQQSILQTIHPYANGEKDYDGTQDGDEVQVALERVTDLAVEFILKHPDLEYFENTFKVNLQKTGIDFLQRALSKPVVVYSSSSPNKEEQVPLQEIQTPRIANKGTLLMSEKQ